MGADDVEAVGGVEFFVAAVRYNECNDGGAVLQRIIFASGDEVPLLACIQKLEAFVI